MFDLEIEAYWQDKINVFGHNYIQVVGGLLWLDNLDINTYPIEMIAHSLSNKCRFAGHTVEFYSVAQHCVIGSRQFKDKQKKKTFLLHDATESIIEDMVTPIKRMLPDYEILEKRISDKLKEVYCIDWKTPEIKNIDNRMLVTEASQLLTPVYPWWRKGRYEHIEPLNIRITPWSPAAAKKRFLREFEKCF